MGLLHMCYLVGKRTAIQSLLGMVRQYTCKYHIKVTLKVLKVPTFGTNA